MEKKSFIDEEKIFSLLEKTKELAKDKAKVKEIVEKSLELKGLDLEDVAVLVNVEDKDLIDLIKKTAFKIKELIYGDRIVMFAPLYISNYCTNDCLYCAFRVTNKEVNRKALTIEEIKQEVLQLVRQGHKRILLVAGESYPANMGGLKYIFDAIDAVYSVKDGKGEIRRLNVNIAPLTVEEFKELKAHKIGTYQIFQEVYHRKTYDEVHVAGKKKDYLWRLYAIDRAFEAGIDDVGIGVLFGLYDWKFELLALFEHVKHLEKEFSMGPHTISIPRIEPAEGAPLSFNPPYAVNDDDFEKLVAIIRLTVPYTGMILSTRETPEMRRRILNLGVSQISAGSRTNPGGYSLSHEEYLKGAQFSLGDHRPLDEVILDLMKMGFTPSFCTACYRVGRTGLDFMELAKPGEIKYKCAPNAFSTLLEYLLDYASEETREFGLKFIEEKMKTLDEKQKKIVEKLLEKVKAGKRDVFV